MRFCVRCCFWWQEGDWCERDSQLGSLRMGRAGNSLLTLKRLCNITQISNALENSGKIYCSAVNTRYCPRPKITRETLIFPEGLFDPAVIMYYCSFVFQCFYIYALKWYICIKLQAPGERKTPTKFLYPNRDPDNHQIWSFVASHSKISPKFTDNFLSYRTDKPTKAKNNLLSRGNKPTLLPVGYVTSNND